jgi:hypothetical protein
MPEQLKIRDVTGRDWEGYYRKISENLDRENMCVMIDGGDYFLTLVSLMSFEARCWPCTRSPRRSWSFWSISQNFTQWC